MKNSDIKGLTIGGLEDRLREKFRENVLKLVKMRNPQTRDPLHPEYDHFEYEGDNGRNGNGADR